MGNSVLTIVWQLLSDPTVRFHDLGPGYHESRINSRRRQRDLVRQLEHLTGRRVILQPAAQPGSVCGPEPQSGVPFVDYPRLTRKSVRVWAGRRHPARLQTIGPCGRFISPAMGYVDHQPRPRPGSVEDEDTEG